MKKILSAILLILIVNCGAYAAANARFHNEATDTTRINEILIETASQNFKDAGQRNTFIARKFIGTPYESGTLDTTPELVTVNLDGLDCTTFVDIVLAMSYTVGEGRTSWRDFVYNLERMRLVCREYPPRQYRGCDSSVPQNQLCCSLDRLHELKP